MKLTATTLLLALVGATAFAQAPATATLRGRVTDPLGAAVAGARVDLRSTATGVERESEADTRGTFVLTDLAPGSYLLCGPAPAFAAKGYPAVTPQGGQKPLGTLKSEAGALNQRGAGT